MKNRLAKLQKKYFSIIMLFLMLFLSACTQKMDKAVENPTEVPKEQTGFYVEGTMLFDANGNPFVMRGVNHMHTWFPEQIEVTLEAIREVGCNTVRIVLSDGEQWDRTGAEEVARIIELCKEHHLIAVLEVHDTTGSYNKNDLLAAAQYFVDIKDVLIGEEAYVIINIANEWPVNEDFRVWRTGYQEAIPILREAGLTHTIMVDCAGGGQYGECIGKVGASVFEADPLGNVMFSVHMYRTAGGSAEVIEQNLRYATEQNLCVCVGEFGYKHGDGDVDEAYIMQYCEENDIGYLAWAWKGNAPEAAYLDLVLQWDGTLSSEWGENVVNGSWGISESAEVCTVFDGE